MKLTIGMIVKNEEKYLEQCLTAIQPILQNVESELIITDTGSTDRTVEIAKKFTDKILHFDWINDFAAARNTTIEAAQGEWYLYLDADEIFRSCDNIIRFFNSGEYKNYSGATYKLKNHLYKNDGTETYDNFYVVRLHRLLPNTRFEGAVHETINTTDNSKLRKLEDECDHYGYLFQSTEESQKKFKRNTEILLKKFEEEKDSDPRIYLQLYDNYRVGDDDETSLKYLNMGIEWARTSSSFFILSLLATKAFFYYSAQEFDKALEVCEEYFKVKPKHAKDPINTDSEIYAIKGDCLCLTERFSESIDVYKKCFDLFKDIQSGKLQTVDMYFITFKLATDSMFLQLFNNFLVCCINTEKYNIADSYLSSLPLGKFCIDPSDVSRLVNLEMKILRHFNYVGVSGYMQKLNRAGKDLLRCMVLNDFYYSEDENKSLQILTELSKVDKSYKAKKRIYEKYYAKKNLTSDILYEFTKENPANVHPDMFMIAMDMGYDISPMFDSPEFDMKQCVYDCYHTFSKFPAIAENYPTDKIEKIEDINGVSRFLEYCLMSINGYKNPQPKLLTVLSPDKLLEKYSFLGERYMKENGITSESELPDNMRAACMIGRILALRREKKYKECMSLIRQVLATHKGVASVMSDYSKDVVKEYEDAFRAEEKNLSEMDRLALTIKNNIRDLINVGNMDAAKKTLAEFETIMPNDPEINDIKKLLT